MWQEDGALGGSCDCPHAADGWFCKHQVALCLVWRDRLAGTATVVDETARRKVQAAARAAQTRRDRRVALHEFLRAQSASALAERLIDLADQFTDIEWVLRVWQKAATARAPKELRTLVTEALTVRGSFLPLSQVRSWVLQAESVLPLLRNARERDARSAADISLHALRRSWAAMQKADDSNGEIGGLCRAIADEWVACLRATGEQPAGFGDTWLRVRLEDPFGCVDEQAVEEIMGSAALERYRRLLAAEWGKARGVPSKSGAPSGRRSARTRVLGEADYHLRAIERLHVAQLEKIGDLDGVLAVLRSDLSEPHRYLEVTRFLEAHGRLREAFANAEVAWRRFPDDWRIEEDLLRMYERDGWLSEAHSLRRSQFEAAPNVERYGRALQSGVAAGRDRDALRAELFGFMEQLEDKAMHAPPPRFARPHEREIAALRNVSLRAQVLVEEGRVDEALALVQPPSVCHPLVLRQIALKLDEGRYGAAVTLLQRVFVHAMRTAQTPYRDELELVRQIQARQDAQSRGAWLAQLRVEFKAKRNFIRGLPS